MRFFSKVFFLIFMSMFFLTSIGFCEAPENTESHAIEEHTGKASSDRFHFTTARIWVFRDFLPDNEYSDILGLEFISAWGWEKFDVTNISYFEVADYATAVPGMPIGNPEGGTEAASGINDLLSLFLFSPKKNGHHDSPHHFAYGLGFQFPTASSDTLGSGKWSVGPSMEYEYHKGRFYAAFIALQLFSVGGDSSRKDVNMLMIKPMITYDLTDNKKWKIVYMPYGVSVYWNKPSGQKVYLPLGGGLQRNFKIGSQDMAFSVQYFDYAVRPSKGSKSDLRFMLEFDF